MLNSIVLMELLKCIKMDLALNNLQRLTYHKTQPNQSKPNIDAAKSIKVQLCIKNSFRCEIVALQSEPSPFFLNDDYSFKKFDYQLRLHFVSLLLNSITNMHFCYAYLLSTT